MSVAAFLPTSTETPLPVLDQQVEAVRTHYAGAGEIRYFASEETVPHYMANRPALRPAVLQQGGHLPFPHVVCFSPFQLNQPEVAFSVQQGARIAALRWDGRLLPHHRELDEGDFQNSEAQIFTRLASTSISESFAYFPWGYLYRFTGMGEVNKFGLRIRHSLAELAGRPENHKVVACFGGSAGWSMRCLPHQMYTEIMQQRLNDHCREKGIDLTFTVLNFGQHGNMVTNEMMAWVHFCHDLKPDVVIAHDGYNDLVYGLMCDPRLLEDALAYQENLEGWSQILHQTSQHPRTQDGLPYRSVNQPVPVVRAYVRRKRQFADLVLKSGARFIWGLQPAACSKKRRHPVENTILKYFSNPDYAPVTAQVEGLYQMLQRSLNLPEGIPFVDCHTAFGRCDETQLLLGDDVHLLKDGDALLAKLYGDAVITHSIGGHA